MRNVGQVPDKARVLVVFHKPLLLRRSYEIPIDRNKNWGVRKASGNNNNVGYKIWKLFYSKVLILIIGLLALTAQKYLVLTSNADNIHAC